jgi:hypothetical protein
MFSIPSGHSIPKHTNGGKAIRFAPDMDHTSSTQPGPKIPTGKDISNGLLYVHPVG